ncbi:MAG: hypothetical protein WD993_03750 [Thermoleophilaceae bacterium]
MESAAHGAGAPGDRQATATGEAPPPPQSPAGAQAAAGGDDAFSERPEIYVGAAFAGGLILAQILRRVGR